MEYTDKQAMDAIKKTSVLVLIGILVIVMTRAIVDGIGAFIQIDCALTGDSDSCETYQKLNSKK